MSSKFLAAVGLALVASVVASQTAFAFGGTVDLISPATCTLEGNLLHSCVIRPKTFTAPAMETAVPMRTKIRVRKSGTCTTQYSLEVSATPNGAPATKLRYIRDAELVVRNLDRSPIASLSIADASARTSDADFNKTCRVSLEIVGNEPDVNSQAEAQAIINGIQEQLNAKRAQAEYYRQLVDYESAFIFLESLTESFHEVLSRGLVNTLRIESIAALPSLGGLISSSCGEELALQDYNSIMSLMYWLGQLEAGGWVDENGNPLTLAEHISIREGDNGENAQRIYETVSRLAAQHSGDGQAEYHRARDQAVAEAVALEAKLNLARAQLATWL